MACTVFGLGTTVETKVSPSHHFQEILHDIHDLRHLEEDENPKERKCVLDATKRWNSTRTDSVARHKKLGQDAHEEFELARGSPNSIVNHATRANPILNALEHERGLSDLSELHELVTETLDTFLVSR